MLKTLCGISCMLSIFLLSNCSNEISSNNWKGQKEFEAQHGKPEFKYHETSEGKLIPEINIGFLIISPIYDKTYNLESKFDELNQDHKNLYNRIFSSKNVMKNFYYGGSNVYSPDNFMKCLIKKMNSRWRDGDKLSAFTIKKRYNSTYDIVIGFVLGGHSASDCCSEIALLLDEDHNGDNDSYAKALGLLMYHLEEVYNEKLKTKNGNIFSTLIANVKYNEDQTDIIINALERSGFKKNTNTLQYEYSMLDSEEVK